VTFTVKPTRVRAEYVHMDKGKPENIGVRWSGNADVSIFMYHQL
jgi:hypothetical protein